MSPNEGKAPCLVAACVPRGNLTGAVDVHAREVRKTLFPTLDRSKIEQHVTVAARDPAAGKVDRRMHAREVPDPFPTPDHGCTTGRCFRTHLSC